MAEHSSATYRFGATRRRSVIAGVASGQLVVCTAALATAVGLLRSAPIAAALPGAVAIVAGAAAFAFVPIAGDTAQRWLPTLSAYGARSVRGTRRDVGVPRRAGLRLRPPGALGGLQLLATDDDEAPGRLGVIFDARESTYAAVLSVRPVALALMGTDERERVVASWGSVLAAVSQSTSLHRLQWIERTVPDRGEALRRAIGRALDEPGARPASRREATESYAQLLAAQSASMLRHECLLVVAVRRPGRSSRPAAVASARSKLEDEIALLAARCRDGGLVVDRALSRAELAVVLRESTDLLPGSRPGWPWPLAMEERWGTLRTDGTVHAVYWIAEWPQTEVHGDFLGPLLVGCRERRALVVTAAPIPPSRALHQAEHARTSERADAALRARHGFMTSARVQRDGVAVLRREEELARGHAAFRFSGYVLVSAPDEDELARACARVEQSAALARLDLRRLYGMQAEAFCAALPLGRGCV